MQKLLLAILLSFFMIPFAQARVDLVPRIIVMEERDRAAEITVLNLSSEVRDVEVDIIDYRQLTPEGNYEPLSSPLNPAFNHQDIVRFSPRTFTLGPNGKQKVRISLRKPADLADGEYRFHARALSYPHDPKSPEGEGRMRIQVGMNVGIAIPVIVRNGELSAESKLSEFELLTPSQANSTKPALKFKAARDGNASTLGQITVGWAKDGNNYEQIGIITNFNVFTEINERIGKVPLDVFPTSGTLRVSYTDAVTGKVYDEIIFDL